MTRPSAALAGPAAGRASASRKRERETVAVTGTVTEPAPAIAVDGLRKRVGSQQVLDGLTFTVGAGEVFGLVGPTGSGKTTALRILATLTRADGGQATIAGVSISGDPKAARRCLGYLPTGFGVHRRQTARECLEFYAAIYGIPRRRRRALAGDLLEIINLADRGDDYADAFDKGETRRLGLASALVHDPAVLLLDEPFSGLEESTRDSVGLLLAELAGMGKSVLLTARRPADVDGTCSLLGHLNDGRLAEDVEA